MLSPCLFSLHAVSVQFSCSIVSDSATPWTAACQAPCASPTSGVYPNSCPLSRLCHPTISSSIVSFSSCLQSFSASGSFPMSQFFTSGGQCIGASASASAFQWIFRTDFLWMDWLDLLAFQGTLNSLLQHHSLKASILWRSAFFIVQLYQINFCKKLTSLWSHSSFIH